MSSLEDAFEQAVTDGVFPGAILLTTNKSGSFTYSHAFGHRSLQSPEPLTTSTPMVLASMTKLMTSIACLQCIERGLIGLDDDVSPLLPTLAAQPILTGFTPTGDPITKPRTQPILLRHLLTHSAGAGYDAMEPKLLRLRGSNPPNAAPTVAERFAFPLTYEPGTSWSYGSGIDWAGQVVEKLTGLPLEQYMRTHIWDPVGADRITFFPAQRPEMAGEMAGMSVRDARSGKVAAWTKALFDREQPPQDAFGGHGAVADLRDYMKILESVGRDDGVLLRPETAALMFEPQLSERSREALMSVMRDPELSGSFVGDFPPEAEYDWGIGGILVRSEGEGRRRRNTLIWSGMPNLFWSIDREAGLCMIFGTQVIPPGDLKVEKMIKMFELSMYEKAAAVEGSKSTL